MKPFRLRHRGHVLASGYRFDTGRMPESEMRRRILTEYRDGAALHRSDTEWLLILDRPALVDADAAPGEVLVAMGGALSTVPLSETEQKEAPLVGVLHADAGDLHGRLWSTFHQEDPAMWLDVGDLTVSSGKSLAAPAAVAAEDMVPLTLRQQAGLPDWGPPPKASWLAELQSWFRGAAAASGQTVVPTRPGPTPPSWVQNLTRQAWRIPQFMGLMLSRQGAYLARLVDMFEKNDMEAALRHAVPLSGAAGGGYPMLFGLFRPRPDLHIHGTPGATGGYVPTPGNWLDMLRTMYKRAATRLEQDEKFERAAFVWIELLNDNETGLALLERHNLFQMAAEVAETRTMLPEIVVRAWFLADNLDRAIQYARRTGAFQAAVLRLERQNDPRAPQLRRLWAQYLADSGQYVQAVEAAGTTLSDADLLPWLDAAIAAGGPAAAAMLARKIAGNVGDWETDVHDLLNEPEAALERYTLVEALQGRQGNPMAFSVGRTVLRQVVEEASEGRNPLTQYTTLRRWAQWTEDFAFKTDLPRLAAPPPRDPPLVSLEWRPGDCGTLPILDAVALASGRTLVACGEGGARLLSRKGKTLYWFDVPTHFLVVSDAGTRAVSVVLRGQQYHLTLLDLAAGTARPWGRRDLTCWAQTFDGAHWLVGQTDGMACLDTLTADPRVLWRMGVPGLQSVVRNQTSAMLACRVLHGTDMTWEKGRVSLPDGQLRERGDVKRALGDSMLALAADGSPATLEPHRLLWPEQDVSVPWQDAVEPLKLAHDGQFTAILIRNETSSVARLYRMHGKLVAEVRILGARLPGLRLEQGSLTISDTGRLTRISLQDMSVQQTRVSV